MIFCMRFSRCGKVIRYAILKLAILVGLDRTKFRNCFFIANKISIIKIYLWLYIPLVDGFKTKHMYSDMDNNYAILFIFFFI